MAARTSLLTGRGLPCRAAPFHGARPRTHPRTDPDPHQCPPSTSLELPTNLPLHLMPNSSSSYSSSISCAGLREAGHGALAHAAPLVRQYTGDWELGALERESEGNRRERPPRFNSGSRHGSELDQIAPPGPCAAIRLSWSGWTLLHSPSLSRTPSRWSSREQRAEERHSG